MTKSRDTQIHKLVNKLINTERKQLLKSILANLNWIQLLLTTIIPVAMMMNRLLSLAMMVTMTMIIVMLVMTLFLQRILPILMTGLTNKVFSCGLTVRQSAVNR